MMILLYVHLKLICIDKLNFYLHEMYIVFGSKMGVIGPLDGRGEAVMVGCVCLNKIMPQNGYCSYLLVLDRV